MYREHTKVVKIGNRVIGGGNPILIQSMTNTKTEDVRATVAQIQALTAAGCDIIRCAVPTQEAVNDLSVSFIWCKKGGAVLSNESSKPCSHIKQLKFCKQIHQTVGRRSTCQTYDAFHKRSDFQQALEPLCLAVLEGGKLIDHHHIEVERDAAFLDEP